MYACTHGQLPGQVDGTISSDRCEVTSLGLDNRQHHRFRLVTQQGIAQPAVLSSLSYVYVHADARLTEQWL